MVLIGAMATVIGKFDRKTSTKRLFFPIASALIMQIYLLISPQLIVQYPYSSLLIYFSIFFLYLVILFLISNGINKLFSKNRAA